MALRCFCRKLLASRHRERTGNTPLEAMVIEYAQLRGTTDGMDTTVITEIAEYYEKELVIRYLRELLSSESTLTSPRRNTCDGLLKMRNIQYI